MNRGKVPTNIEYRQIGAVAQSVEQRTENPCVAGSIPAHTTETSTAMLGFFVLVSAALAVNIYILVAAIK